MTSQSVFYESQSLLCNRSVFPSYIEVELIDDPTRLINICANTKNSKKFMKKAKMLENLDCKAIRFFKACELSSKWYNNNRAFYRVYPEIIKHVIKKGIEVDRHEKKTGIDQSQNIQMPPISFEFMKNMTLKIPIDVPKSIEAVS